jgi:hypothetical protein
MLRNVITRDERIFIIDGCLKSINLEVIYILKHKYIVYTFLIMNIKEKLPKV